MKVVSYYYNVIGGGIMECKESLRKIIEDIESYVNNNNIVFPYNIENILDNLEKIASKYATFSFLSSPKDFFAHRISETKYKDKDAINIFWNAVKLRDAIKREIKE